MTIIQLEYLISVAKYGSFSTAANYCYVTQPSLSTQIKNLEDELGVILLNRGSKPLTLTEAGKVVIDRAKEVIAGFYNIEEVVKGLRNEVSGTLRIAAIPTIAPYLLHRFIPEFVNLYPNLNLQVKEMFTRDIIAAIDNDSIDVAILAAGFLDGTDIKEEVLFDDHFYFYAAKDNEMLQQKDVSVIDLDINSLLLLADGHCLRTQILDLCNARNPLGKNLRLEGGSLETIIRMVDKTHGATILPKMAVDFLPEDKKAECVREFKEHNSAKRQISLAIGKNFIKNAALTKLKEIILKNI